MHMGIRRAWLQLRGSVERVLVVFGFSAWYWLGAVAILVAFVANLYLRTRGAQTYALGIAGGAAVFAALLRDAVNFESEHRNLRFIDGAPGPSICVEARDVASGYAMTCVAGQTVVLSHRVNRALRSHALSLDPRVGRFVIPAQARRIGPLVLQSEFAGTRVLYNDRKVRMATDLHLDLHGEWTRAHVRLERTDYFASLCTNEVTGRPVMSRTDTDLAYDGWSFVVRGDRLLGLEDCYASNHIGVSSVGVTRDGYLLFGVQPDDARHNSSMLVPGGSGSVDLVDLRGANSLQDMLASAMQREFVEERGFPSSLAQGLRTQVLGFARLVSRGGKPEFFGVTYCDFDSQSVPEHGYEAGQKSRAVLIPAEELGHLCGGDEVRMCAGLPVGVQAALALRMLFDSGSSASGQCR